MGYLIKKNDKTQEIVYLDYDINGYVFTPKNQSQSSLTVNKVVIVNPSMIDKILTIKFNALYKKIVTEALKVIYDDDAGASEATVVLNDLKRLKRIVEHRYQEFLSAEKEAIFLKKIKQLENELKVKIMLARERMLETEDNYGKGR